MMELYEYDDIENLKSGARGVLAVLDEACNVCIEKEINTTDRITFEFPLFSEKAELIRVNRLVKCEGQAYRIMKVNSSDSVLTAEGMHIWYADSPAVHISSVQDNIGITPYSLVEACADKTESFSIVPEEEMNRRGLHWIGKGELLKNAGEESGREFAIDFFAVDKISLFDFVKTVTDNAGFGEMYYDNNSFAVAEKIGKDTGIRLSLDENAENISVETDISSMITRLYPYGYEDMTIGSVYGKNYIDSPNISLYGLKEGYKDYSDYTNVYDLFYNASWEFDKDNPARLDVPSVSVSGRAADLSRLTQNGDFDKICLGDTVTVTAANGMEICERVTAIKYYPYESIDTELTIGRTKRDLYFYLSQVSQLAKRYSKCSTTSGKISSRAISGKKQSSSVQISSQSAIAKGDELITVVSGSSTRVKIGIADGEYVFKVCGNDGELAINTDSAQGGMNFRGTQFKAPRFILEYDGGACTFSADENGVYINGEKIVTEEQA